MTTPPGEGEVHAFDPEHCARCALIRIGRELEKVEGSKTTVTDSVLSPDAEPRLRVGNVTWIRGRK